MEELMLGHVYDRIQTKIVEISPENTMKILIRCKMMFYCRTEMINILKIIDLREQKLKDLNYYVIQKEGTDKQEREKLLRTKV